jgi:hypothetical protein
MGSLSANHSTWKSRLPPYQILIRLQETETFLAGIFHGLWCILQDGIEFEPICRLN